MQLTQQQLVQILPSARQFACVFVSALNQAMARFGIDSPVRSAAFLAQIGHESQQLTALSENLNYGAPGLARTWPTRFRGTDGRPNALALQIQHRPEAIANSAYANRNGNGDEATGDGWRYRGRGLIQLTGRANYRAAGAGIGADLEQVPQLLEQPVYAALSAAWYWKEYGLNELADAGKFEAITKRINGGLNGQAERVALWEAAKRVLA